MGRVFLNSGVGELYFLFDSYYSVCDGLMQSVQGVQCIVHGAGALIFQI